MAQTVEEWYKAMPVVTRTYLTVSFFTTAACALDVRHASRALPRARTQSAGRLAGAARPCSVAVARRRRGGSCGLCCAAARVRVAAADATACGFAQLISPFTVYFNARLIWEGQLWRLASNFFFFGSLGAPTRRVY